MAKRMVSDRYKDEYTEPFPGEWSWNYDELHIETYPYNKLSQSLLCSNMPPGNTTYHS